MPARAEQQAQDSFIDVNGAVSQAAPPPPLPPPPPPPLTRPAKVPASFLSQHLSLCTEGLGSESSGDLDLSDLTDDVNNADDACLDDAVGQVPPFKRRHRDGSDEERRKARPVFPPPISVIGAGGKPWLYLRPHREDGRLVLREMRIPCQELLQARREDGRFKLQFAQPQLDEPPPHPHRHQCQDQETADAMPKEKTQQGNE